MYLLAYNEETAPNPDSRRSYRLKDSTAQKPRQIPPGYLLVDIDPHKKSHAAPITTPQAAIVTKFKVDNMLRAPAQKLDGRPGGIFVIIEKRTVQSIDCAQCVLPRKDRANPPKSPLGKGGQRGIYSSYGLANYSRISR